MSNWNMAYPPEFTVVRNAETGIEVRTPAYPEDANYVRVVATEAQAIGMEGELRGELELFYWDEEEWRTEGSDEDVMGVILSAIQQVVVGKSFETAIAHAAFAHEES